MKLPDDFRFSQSSLQDFADCRRRFYLRHISRLAWPAVESEPVLEHERAMQMGTDFHRLAQQRLIGIPSERLSALIHDPELHSWWTNFVDYLPQVAALDDRTYPETVLTAPLAGCHLVAKYDLIVATKDARLLIYDWKTARQPTKRQYLEKRLQTRLYPYLLARAGAHLNQGQPVSPQQVEMVYWFAAGEGAVERFPYSAAAYQADQSYLTNLIETIQGLGESEFPMTSDERRCAYCVYRSLCERGERAGDLEAFEAEATLDSPAGFDIDFEQVAEIEF